MPVCSGIGPFAFRNSGFDFDGGLSIALRPIKTQQIKFGLQRFLAKELGMTIGSQPAENRSKRTSGTRAAGLRRAEAAARRRFATSLTLELQLTKYKFVRKRTAGLCGERLPPTDPQFDYSFLIFHFEFFICGFNETAAARSRSRAEGCSSTSQARPLGCGLVPSLGRSVRTVRAAASRRRRPAVRVRICVHSAGCDPKSN